jgi:hypothetical protein
MAASFKDGNDTDVLSFPMLDGRWTEGGSPSPASNAFSSETETWAASSQVIGELSQHQDLTSYRI